MDVVFAPLGIDESKNKRRYLNGQVIIQEQFPAFTSAVKARMSTMANAFTTETNWQAEKTNSKFGQCGKFVVDDTAGTIRLPCVVNAQGLADLALIGGIKSESLPNITGDYNSVVGYTNASKTKAFQDSTVASSSFGASGSGVGRFNLKFSASKSSSTYQDNAPVQQEAIQYPYCIVVNVGVEEPDRPINNYQVNNVYSYGMSQYYKGTMNNNSWLKSAGQWNDGTVYTGMYNWLLEQMNAGVNGVKGTIGYCWKKPNEDIRWWTATRNPKVGAAVYGFTDMHLFGYVTAVNEDGTINFFEEGLKLNQINLVYTESQNVNIEGTGFGNLKFANDYDFVINTTDQTFRLPLLNGDRVLVKKYVNGTDWYNLYSDGWIEQGGSATGIPNFTISFLKPFRDANYTITTTTRTGNGDTTVRTMEPILGQILASSCVLQSCPSFNGTQFFWLACGYAPVPTQSDFAEVSGLYYYVGDTLQNAQLINVARIEETLVTKTNKVQAAEASMPSGRYIDLTLGSSGTTYTAPANGWFWFSKIAGTNLFGVGIENKRNGMIIGSDAGAPGSGNAVMPVLAGDNVVVRYSATGETLGFRFIYAQGDQ